MRLTGRSGRESANTIAGIIRMTAEARASRYLNPGNGNVSKLCHEPQSRPGGLDRPARTLLLEPAAAGSSRARADSRRRGRATASGPLPFATARPAASGHSSPRISSTPRELGDLLPLAGVEFVTGAEGQDQTGEPHAPGQPQPDNQQGITCCFAVDYLDGQDHTIDRPAEYDFWETYVPARHARVAGTAARFELRRSDHAQAGQPRLRPSRSGPRALGLSAHH